MTRTLGMAARLWWTALVFVSAAAAPLMAQTADSPARPAWASGAIIDIPADELAIRLVPLDLDELELIRQDVMAEVRDASSELADTMIERQRLAQAGDADTERIESVAQQTVSLLIRKKVLTSRARAVLDAIEAKGGEVSSDRAYLEAVGSLRPDLGATFMRQAETPTVTQGELALQRVEELVAIVNAEPPTHERPVPWNVPIAELQLELQPLPTEQVLARLDAWQSILQRQVRKRIQIDILLNNPEKLERSLEVRNEGARLVGASTEDITLDELKAALAEQAEAQQRIITAIVERMRVAIELCKRRGEDAQQYIDYIASATGRKLNFTDLSVLRVQLMQWLTSPAGGLLIARRIALFIGIVLLFWIIGRVAGAITDTTTRRIPKTSSLLGPVLSGIVQKLLIVLGFIIAASAVGVDAGPLLAMIGAAGLVIGLALQGTLSNFASGILILINRPFDVGDVVDAGGVFGKVSAMNLVSTTILTFDNQLMLVPNNQIWNAVITNVTGKDTRRVDLTFGIAYTADIAKAVEVLEEVLGAHPLTLEDPAPVVRVHELADSSVNLIARPWVRTDDYWDVYWDLMRQVKERFDAEGIAIPFPQRDLHVPGAIEVKLTGGGRHERPATTPNVPPAPPPATPEASRVRESGPPTDHDEGDDNEQAD